MSGMDACQLWKGSHVIASDKAKPSVSSIDSKAILPMSLMRSTHILKQKNTDMPSHAPLAAECMVISGTPWTMSEDPREGGSSKSVWPSGAPDCILKSTNEFLLASSKSHYQGLRLQQMSFNNNND